MELQTDTEDNLINHYYFEYRGRASNKQLKARFERREAKEAKGDRVRSRPVFVARWPIMEKLPWIPLFAYPFVYQAVIQYNRCKACILTRAPSAFLLSFFSSILFSRFSFRCRLLRSHNHVRLAITQLSIGPLHCTRTLSQLSFCHRPMRHRHQPNNSRDDKKDWLIKERSQFFSIYFGKV